MVAKLRNDRLFIQLTPIDSTLLSTFISMFAKAIYIIIYTKFSSYFFCGAYFLHPLCQQEEII